MAAAKTTGTEFTPEPGTRANPMLDLARVARRLSVSKKTVRRMIKRGELGVPHRVGAKLCITEAAVVAYLRGARVRVVVGGR